MASSSTRRLRMRDWLFQMLENNNIHGICWEDRSELIFKIDWKHGSRHGYTYEKDALVFRKWAEYTGKLRLATGPDPKRWKANFRCALNSLRNIKKIDSKQYKGAEAFRRYQFIMEINNKNNIRNRQKTKMEKEKIPLETAKCSATENEPFTCNGVQIKQEAMDDTQVDAEIKSEETFQCAFRNSYCYPLDQENHLTPPNSPETKFLTITEKTRPVKIECNPCDLSTWCSHSTFGTSLSPPLTPPEQLLPDLEMCIENLSPADVNRFGNSCLDEFDEFANCEDAQI